MPDVGVDLAVHKLKLIQLRDRGATVSDNKAANFAKSSGIEVAESCGAIAHDQILAVLCESPAFAEVIKSTQQAEGGSVVDKRSMRLPSELDQRVSPLGETFGKVAGGHIKQIEDAAGFQFLHSQRGVAFEASALVKMAVGVDESLREGLLVMGISLHDAKRIGRMHGRDRRNGNATEDECSANGGRAHRY